MEQSFSRKLHSGGGRCPFPHGFFLRGCLIFRYLVTYILCEQKFHVSQATPFRLCDNTLWVQSWKSSGPCFASLSVDKICLSAILRSPYYYLTIDLTTSLGFIYSFCSSFLSSRFIVSFTLEWVGCDDFFKNHLFFQNFKILFKPSQIIKIPSQTIK